MYSSLKETGLFLENKDLFKLEVLSKELEKVQAEKTELDQAETDEEFQKLADLKTQECKLIEDIDLLEINRVGVNLLFKRKN